MRNCRECSASIETRGASAKLCEPCAISAKARSANSAKNARSAARRLGRTCECGSPIAPERCMHAKRCPTCAKLRVRATEPARQKRYALRHPEKTAARILRNNKKRHRIQAALSKEKRFARVCACGASIATRYHNARSCEACTQRVTDEGHRRYAELNQAKAHASKTAYRLRKAAERGAGNCTDCSVTVKRPRKYCEPCSAERKRVTRLVSQNRRRVRLEGQSLDVSETEWRDCLEEHDHRCAYCLHRVSLTMDHVIPVSAGGRNEISNIVPACQPCNSRKGNKHIWQMLRTANPVTRRRRPHPAPAE